MAKIIYALNQSLDGYVDHTAFGPDLKLFCHFIEDLRSLTGTLYGRRMYEIMSYWEDDQPGWKAHQHDFAAAWRNERKWVVSSQLRSVGTNATLVQEDLEPFIRRLKSELTGNIGVAGPNLAGSLTKLNLIDEYRLYLHPVVLGHGTPYFTGPRPPLRLTATDRITDNVIRLTYVPA
jgi:dihydrofolate reductase